MSGDRNLSSLESDLLDALCDALPHVEGWLDEPGFKPGTVRATVNKIKAVIAKAEAAQ